MKLIEEHGKNGIFIINTNEKMVPQDFYFNEPPLVLINHIQSNTNDLNKLDPHEIDSIRIRPPLEMVQIRGIKMVGGMVLIYTKQNVPLKEPLLSDSTFTVHGEQIKLPTFQLELKLSKLAERELRESNESIVIVAFFSGKLKNGNDDFEIGKYSVEVTSERIVTLDNVYISTEKFEKLENSNFQVLINVYSGRKSSQFNILDVEILQEPIVKIKGKRHYLKGQLLTEM